MKLAKNLDRLGTETAFSVLAEAKKLEALIIGAVIIVFLVRKSSKKA